MALRKAKQVIEIVSDSELLGYDDYNEPIYGEKRVKVPVYSVAPSVVEEESGGIASWSSQELTVYAPSKVKVEPQDRIVWQAKEYQVVGDDSEFTNIYTLTKLNVFRIKRVEGA